MSFAFKSSNMKPVKSIIKAAMLFEEDAFDIGDGVSGEDGTDLVDFERMSYLVVACWVVHVGLLVES